MEKSLRMKLLIILLVVLMVFSMTACGTKLATGGGTSTIAPTTTSASTQTAPVDLLAKYSPEINLTAWRYLYNNIKFEGNDDIENNVYMTMYKEELGINLSYAWVVPEDQFDQKLNISVAAGDLPDIMWLRNKQLIELTENDLLYDLTDLYQTYTSDFTKSILEQDEAGFKSAKVGGRLMAIPNTGSSIDSLQILFVRTDWLDKLGLSVPTTMQELLAVAEAFTKNDPDGNGKDDTYGLALTKGFMKDNHAGATGFFAGYHGYIRRWIKDDSGNLVYGSIQPEVKRGLQELQNMYKKGLIDPEFGVKDRAKVTETVTSGKVGITYGGMSSTGAFLKDNVANDPNADWVSIPLVSIDDKPAAPITKMPVQRYYAVSKDCKNPEAIMKITEKAAELYSPPPITEEMKAKIKKFGITETGIATFQYGIVYFEPAKKNLNAHLNVLKAKELNDTSILNAEEFQYYEKIEKYNAGDRSQWGEARIFGSPGSFDIINQYVESKNMIYDGFYGAQTPTMIERNATLESMEEEVFTKIIMGESIDSFDKFVTDWKALGGDQITKEVNEWYAKNK